MKEADILKDILEYRISNQKFYNNNMVYMRNPEIRRLYTELRDDEMRAIVKLQQAIERMEGDRGIIGKIITSGPRY